MALSMAWWLAVAKSAGVSVAAPPSSASGAKSAAMDFTVPGARKLLSP